MIRLKPVLIFGSIGLALAAIVIFGGRWARVHVNYMTAAEDHPIKCWTCHVYTQQDNLIAKLINETYVSPYNLAITEDGNRLYVVGQESNEVVVVDPLAGKVLEKIAVGERPHSFVLGKDGKTGFVSNQWADNIYRIDLEKGEVTDTLKTGSGPAGMAISLDGDYLWCANSYSSDVSVIDLQSDQERRRLKAGNNPVSAAMTPDGSGVYVSSRRSLKVPYLTSPVTEMTVLGTRNQHVSERKLFKNAYIMENVRVTPSGDLAIATLTRPNNLIPAVQIERVCMMTHVIGII